MTGVTTTDNDRLIVKILLWSAFTFNMTHVLSLVLRHLVYFRWLMLKQLITREDTLGSTGYWKSILVDILVQCVIPYPFINDYYYYENNGRFEAFNVQYKYNHVLLAVMIFTRIYQLVLSLLLLTYWSAPRAQRIW